MSYGTGPGRGVPWRRFVQVLRWTWQTGGRYPETLIAGRPRPGRVVAVIGRQR